MRFLRLLRHFRYKIRLIRLICGRSNCLNYLNCLMSFFPFHQSFRCPHFMLSGILYQVGKVFYLADYKTDTTVSYFFYRFYAFHFASRR